MKKIIITIAVVMLAMTAMSALTGCSSCGHKAKAKAAYNCGPADCAKPCKGAKAKACCGGAHTDCKGKKAKKACCDYAGTAACCGKNAPDALVSCAMGGCEVAAKDAVKIADGKYACGHCAKAAHKN